MWALAIALAMDKNTGVFSVLDQNETQFYTYMSQTARQPPSRRSISSGSSTEAGDLICAPVLFVSKVFGVNYEKANRFHCRFIMLTDSHPDRKLLEIEFQYRPHGARKTTIRFNIYYTIILNYYEFHYSK